MFGEEILGKTGRSSRRLRLNCFLPLIAVFSERVDGACPILQETAPAAAPVSYMILRQQFRLDGDMRHRFHEYLAIGPACFPADVPHADMDRT
jgi:hypothetical protein